MQATYIPPQESEDVLAKYTINLVAEAKAWKIDPVIGREDETRRTIEILSRRTKNNPILIGDPGVGKTAIVEGMAHKIARGEVPENLKNIAIHSLDLAAIMAGAKYRWEFEERIKSLLQKIEASEGSIVLFIDEIHMIIGAGAGEGSSDVANIMKPALSRGRIKVIGATTLAEYRKYFEKDAALERRFQPIFVDEPTRDDTVSILRGIKERYETFHGIEITDQAIVDAVDLSLKYIPDRRLPDKAIDLVDEAAASVRTTIASRPAELEHLEKEVRTLEIEKAALEREKDTPAERIKELTLRLDQARSEAKQKETQWKREKEIVSEKEQIKATIESLKFEASTKEREMNFNEVARIRYSEIPRREKELSEVEQKLAESRGNTSFLQEKVGSSDIARVVSKWTGIPVGRLGGSERNRVAWLEAALKSRIIGQNHAIESIARTITRNKVWLGDPKRPIGSFLLLGPTWVGKTETAKALAVELFAQEDALIRIDMGEYTEAHSVAKLIGAPPGYVWYDEGGQLTEAVRKKPYSVILFDEIEKAHPEVFKMFLEILDEGHLTDGKGKRVNFKNTLILMTSNALTESSAKNRSELMHELTGWFRPEFLNRIDEIILYQPLSEIGVQAIAAQEIASIVDRLHAQGVELEVDPEALEWVSVHGYDAVYGARPLKRMINREILDPVAALLIQKPDTQTIWVSLVDGALCIK